MINHDDYKNHLHFLKFLDKKEMIGFIVENHV